MTVVGTVTYVNHNRVLAMGHPFLGSGPIDLPMVNAYVHTIISSQDVSFKMASGGEVIGRWTEDRPWSVGGALGQKASEFPATFALWDKSAFEEELQCEDQPQPGIDGPHRGHDRQRGHRKHRSHRGRNAAGRDERHRERTADIYAPQHLYPAGQRGGGLLSLLFGGGGSTSPAMEFMDVLNTLENNSFGPVQPERVRMSAEWERERKVANIEDVRARVKRVRPAIPSASMSSSSSGTNRKRCGPLRWKYRRLCRPADCRSGWPGGVPQR